MTRRPRRAGVRIVILGGVLSRPGLYAEMQRTLAEHAGVPVSIVRTGIVDWVLAVSAVRMAAHPQEARRGGRRAAASAGCARVVLVGHSSGGVIGRLYLSPEPFRGERFAGLERVAHLVTLGSPNTNQRVGPMRRWVDRRYPGAYFAPAVRYTSVAGKWREGRRRGEAAERAAFAVYKRLGGNGATWGDGLVPVEVAPAERFPHRGPRRSRPCAGPGAPVVRKPGRGPQLVGAGRG